MVLLGLLVIALACLIIGLTQAQAVWFIASLVASIGAGYLLWRARDARPASRETSDGSDSDAGTKAADRPDETEDDSTIQLGTAADPGTRAVSTAGAGASRDAAAPQSSNATGQPADVAPADVPVGVSANAAAAPLAASMVKPGQSAQSAQSAQPAQPAQAPEPDDERPGRFSRFFGRDVSPAAGTVTTSAAPEAMGAPEDVRASAGTVAQNGHSNGVAAGSPATSPAVTAPAATAPVAESPSGTGNAGGATGDATGEVWVIDGRPRYHRADCGIIRGQDAEPIPLGQATEDGFMPCSLCGPEVMAAR